MEKNRTLKSLEQLQKEKLRYQVRREKMETFLSLVFTVFRAFVTYMIVIIFVVIDYKIFISIQTFDINKIIAFTSEQISIIKYIALFLTFQLIIFSQGFGFSSVVKLITAISNAIPSKKIQPEPKENEK